MLLHAKYSADQIREKAMAKHNEIFGLIAKLIQRIQPEDIKISTFQKHLEPFWFVVVSSRYVDRRHKYRVEVAPKVHAATVHGNKYSVRGACASALGNGDYESSAPLLCRALEGICKVSHNIGCSPHLKNLVNDYSGCLQEMGIGVQVQRLEAVLKPYGFNVDDYLVP